jgi:glutamate 5-kinase
LHSGPKESSGWTQARSGHHEQGKEPLPSGIIKVEGDFARGECVEISSGSGRLLGRGIANYSSSDVTQIKGSKSVEIEKKLGYKYTEEVIHRDNMVVL